MNSEKANKAFKYAVDLIDPSASTEELHAVIRLCSALLVAETNILKSKFNKETDQ